ncbi:MAG TPA: isochorismatase family cysteine hydrolase [Chloroflexota bacterium]
MVTVTAETSPYHFDLDSTALLVIDMQNDFCSPGGYGALMGYDVSLTRAPIEPIRRVLEAARGAGMKIIHTREGHRPDLSDCPANKLEHSKQMGAGIGDMGPLGRILVRGEKGHAIIDEVQPMPGEVILDKPGKGSFYQTDLDLILRNWGVTHLIFTGVTTDVCVHTTLRDANDRGIRCLLLEDCCGAFDPELHAAAVKMVKMQGGIFGWVSIATHLVRALAGAPALAAAL